MKTVLLNMKVCGFKNIEKPIEIQFANKNVDKTTFLKPHVKAIYGTNGMGKSAIVFAMNTYYKTVTDKNFLAFESTRGDLCDMINKKTNCAFVDLYFATYYKEDDYKIMHHSICYSLKDKEVSIQKECLSLVKGNRWGDENNEEKFYEVENNEIKYLYNKISEKLNNRIVDNSKNLLSESSLLLKCIYLTDDQFKSKYDIMFSRVALFAAIFVIYLNVFIDEKDSHRISASIIKSINETTRQLGENNLSTKDEFVIDDGIDDISEGDIKTYEKQVKKICKFIQVFKPDLKNIIVDKIPLGNGMYRCKKILVYKDNVHIDSKYESNGIKKLIKLYPILNNAENGGVTFVDEFDSNIHDVYLCKLIEYFISYSNGQLVFTTHNLGPMEVLSDSEAKHSIDFINNSKISSWVKNGNYSVVNVYRSGAIPNCPFNIDSADFVRTFGD